MRVIQAILAVALLSGCKANIDLTLFISDVLEVARTGATIDTTAVLGVNAGSQASCNTHSAAVANALSIGFKRVEFLGCRAESFETYGEFRVAVPMIQANTEFDQGLAIWVTPNDQDTVVALKPNAEVMESIVASLPSDLTFFLSGKPEPKIRVTLQNDMTDTVTAVAQGAFVDGSPYQLPTDIPLERRDEAIIAISDVGNAAMNYGGTLLFWIKQ